jgi:S-adenosylmethionine:tRNA ribosyltransferase-isomerase
MKLEALHFDLPEERIAQQPSSERDQSRLLVLDRSDGSVRHLHFKDIRYFLKPEDALVVNRTRVMPARLKGIIATSGGKVELLLLTPLAAGEWLAMGRPFRRLIPGKGLIFGDGVLKAEVIERLEEGQVRVRFTPPDISRILNELGEIPLPPYIRRPPTEVDMERYQTVFAKDLGAVAAPTAGLHFTEPLLESIQRQGTAVVPLVLHVGPGTFSPIRHSDLTQHRMAAEFYRLEEAQAQCLRQRRQAGGCIVAVGTTVVRTLETVAAAHGEIAADEGQTDIFIYPPYDFKAVDRMVTNFHLPGSTLLALVGAFAGLELVLDTYRQAVAAGYRFYSYGDAMLIL